MPLDRNGDPVEAEVLTRLPIDRTTIDNAWQMALERAVGDVLPDTGGRFVASAMVLDIETAQIRAVWVDRHDPLGIERLTDERPSGSTLKLLTLAAALNVGIEPQDLIEGRDRCLFDGVDVASGAAVRPLGTVTEMTANSVNCAFARLAEIVGRDRMRATADGFGLPELSLDAQVGAGTNTVSMDRLAAIMTAFAGDGRSIDPSFDPTAPIRERRVLDPAVAALGRLPLLAVVQRGTGRAAWSDAHPAIGKTGTQPGNTDAWFVGADRRAIVVVWMGNPNEPGDSMDMIPELAAAPTVRGGGYPALIAAAVWAALPAEGAEDGTVSWDPPVDRGSTYLLLAPGRDCSPAATIVGIGFSAVSAGSPLSAC